jgi:hypothetical protein
MSHDLNDTEMDAIWERARENAIHDIRDNPYPRGTIEAAFYNHAFRWAYNKENAK